MIGKGGKMPWRLPAESAYFRDTTRGHPVIIGRKNFDAMKRPLPNRPNIVITRQKDYKVPGGTTVVHSFESALALPMVKGADEVFVLGGQQIYELAIPLADKLYFTQIDAKIDGDTFFNYNPDEWKLVWSGKHPPDEENEYAFELRQLIRKP